MEKIDYVFQTDSEIIENTYIQNSNYLIEYSDKKELIDKYCIIYFSSHNIYDKNDEETFRTQVLKKNKFEWYNTRILKGSKHIFIRDIKKQWYLTGINYRINTIEKLYEFLQAESNGYKIITLGSSAGGFAAILIGSMLNAETILTFNGQFLLSDLLSDSSKKLSSEKIDPIIHREKNNFEINKYFSLRPYIKDSKNILYFYSDRSEWDVIQFNHISDFRNIQFIAFRTKHHGIPFLKTNLSSVLNMPIEKIHVFVGKINSPIIFSIKIDGLLKTVKDFTIIVFKYIYRKAIPLKLV